jgi:hypothetical protein
VRTQFCTSDDGISAEIQRETRFLQIEVRRDLASAQLAVPTPASIAPRAREGIKTPSNASPITPSIASALNLLECEQPSSIGGGDPLASRLISLI